MPNRFREASLGLTWASEGGEGGAKTPWILKLLAKKVVFPISRGKNQISPLLVPRKKFWENPLLAPPGKNPSDALEG